MKVGIIYYSYTGHCKNYAKKLNKKIPSELIELRDAYLNQKKSFIKYANFSASAYRNQYSTLKSHVFEKNKYDHLIIITPVWVGHLPPAFNTFFKDNIIDTDITLIISCFTKYDFILNSIKNNKLQGEGKIIDHYTLYDRKPKENQLILNKLIKKIKKHEFTISKYDIVENMRYDL